MYAPFFILVFIFASSLFASPHNDATWAKLFHYHDGKLLINVNDFLAPKEKQQSFSLDFEISYWEKLFEKNDQVAICKFPARYWWWSQGKGPKPEEMCPNLAIFISEFDIKKVSLVFSSYYAQNSASLFGHTFLRFMRAQNRGQELLDWGISYSAHVENLDPISTAYKSFFSSFDGSLQLMPYYYKVREYNDFEFRPLWSYGLKINQSEIRFLLYHLWELSQIQIPYQYLSHNCSSLILDILAILRPQDDFRKDLAFYHIPIDTVKVLKKYDLIEEEVHYRPSLMQEWEDKYSKLTEKQKKIFKEFLQSKNDSLLTEVELVDAALDFYDFKYGRKLISKEGENTKLKEEKNALLFKRSKFPLKSYPALTTEEKPPDQVHATRRIGLGISVNDNHRQRLWMNYRFAYHDPIDPIEGMTSRMKINFVQPEISYDDDQSLKLERLDLLEIASWSYSPPLSHSLTYELGISWLRWQQVYDQSTQFHWVQGSQLQTAAGFTFDVLGHSYWAAMLEQQLSYAENRPDSLGLKIGPSIMFHTDFDKIRLRLTGKKLYEVTGYQNYSRTYEAADVMASITLSHELVLSFKQTYYNNYNESFLAWYYYY